MGFVSPFYQKSIIIGLISDRIGLISDHIGLISDHAGLISDCITVDTEIVS
jgi:hypothetical protein